MENKLSTQDLVELLVSRHGMSQENASDFVQAFFDLIEEELVTEGVVKVKGLGVFRKVAVEARDSISVNSGERIQIEGYNKVTFTPEPAVRDSVNRPFSCFESVVLKDSAVFEDLKETDPDMDREDADPEEADRPVAVETTVGSEPESTGTGAKEADGVTCLKQETESTETAGEEHRDECPDIHRNEHQNEHRPEKGNWAVSLLMVACAAVLLCGGFLAYMYWEDSFRSDDADGQPADVWTEVSRADTLAAPADTLVPDEEMTGRVEADQNVRPAEVKTEEPGKAVVLTAKKADRTESVRKPGQPAENKVYSEDVHYRIAGTKATHKLKNGESLIRLSLKYYGVKGLWPYIVRHNQSVISDPDHVPAGTVLKIPELSEE